MCTLRVALDTSREVLLPYGTNVTEVSLMCIP